MPFVNLCDVYMYIYMVYLVYCVVESFDGVSP